MPSESIEVATTITHNLTPQRARRKSAKAAAAFVTAVVKEEMLVPPAPTASKRSYARANSLGSMVSSSTSVTHSHNSSSGSLTQVREVVLKNSKGHPKKKTALSSYAVEYLKAWMMSPDHIEHPYPTEDEKVKIMKDTSIELKQLTNWFVNNRKRYWKPKVEEMRAQSLSCNVSLQEMAAAAQAAGGGSVVAVARMASEKSGSRTHSSPVVSSEGEDSSVSTRDRNSAKSSNKKRKKYSTLDKEEHSALTVLPAAAAMNSHVNDTRSNKKAKEDDRPSPVVNPMVALPAQGIATARTYESVKAARKMSRTVSEPSSNEESEESDSDENKSQDPMAAAAVKAVVSNPLATTVSTPPPVLTTMVSSSTINSSSGNLASTVAATEAVHSDTHPALVPLTADQVADLEYSITTLDAELAENAGETDATSAVDAVVSAATICCGGIMPHSCNLADPLGAKNPVAHPCALCSACRDWNLGEFCPWDLTGILGDISAEIPEPSSSSSQEEDEDDYFNAPSMDGSTEEATTITKNSTVADGVTSMDKSMSFGSVPQEISHSTMTHSTSAADFMSSMADLENWD